jgi:hypothetical protein
MFARPAIHDNFIDEYLVSIFQLLIISLNLLNKFKNLYSLSNFIQ